MSTTDIYQLGSNPGQIGRTRNAFRGAMYVWVDIAKRYLGMPSFPSDSAAQYKVWNAFKHVTMSEHDKIVLIASWDYAVVYGKDLDKVIQAFLLYGTEHPQSSIHDQAVIMSNTKIEPDDCIAWCQTSVIDFWGVLHDGEEDQIFYYDLETGTKHIDVMKVAATGK